jgi:WW domain-binding protein 2
MNFNNSLPFYSSILLCCNNVTLDFSGGHQAEMKGNKVGKLFLTTHRAIFLNGDSKDKFQSFSFPFVTMSEVELEQPMFGANFIKGKVRAQANGNWVGEAKFKLHFKHGGAIDFGQALLKAAHMGESLD